MSNELSIINSLPQGQAGIDKFSDDIIQSVKSGNANPLEIYIALKGLEKATRRISTEIADNINRERALYPERVLLIHGAEVSGLTPTYTKYDFSWCNDEKLADLGDAFTKAKTAFEDRQEFLKKLPVEGQVIVSDNGEAVTIYPPKKIQTEGVKISFR